ncbi:hypothetical protein DFH11DRAFT_1759110 [Phellopilus nigrolimitatus]|nr:hypothetical protein DFH11DRAFT_1759110 [Phellopilus nigrolimitatus]
MDPIFQTLKPPKCLCPLQKARLRRQRRQPIRMCHEALERSAEPLRKYMVEDSDSEQVAVARLRAVQRATYGSSKGGGGLLGGVMRGVGMVGGGIGISGSSSFKNSGSDGEKGTGAKMWVRGVSKSQNQNTSQGQKLRSTKQAALGKQHSASLPHVDSEISLQHRTSRRSLGVDQNANLEKRDKSASRVRRENTRTDPEVPRMSGESRRPVAWFTHWPKANEKIVQDILKPNVRHILHFQKTGGKALDYIKKRD